MRCRDFVAGLLLAGAGRRRATRRGEQQQRSGAPPTRRSLFQADVAVCLRLRAMSRPKLGHAWRRESRAERPTVRSTAAETR
jgi:hypothetical protein